MLSDDPVIQWCLDEALGARVRVEENRQHERQAALAEAQGKAQAALRAATR